MTTVHADDTVLTPSTTSELRELTAAHIPPPPFQHLLRLTDDVGLFEHAYGPLPKRWHGYCVDDVSRALIVVCREPQPDAALVAAAETYLAFLMHAQGGSAGFHNRFGMDRVWHDEPAVMEWWGRALWAFGTAAARAPLPWMRRVALERFAAAAPLRSPEPRAMVFAALGAAEVLTVHPAHVASRELLADAAAMVGPPAPEPDWCWPQEELTYANAALAEVLIAAGDAAGDDGTRTAGLLALGWLLATETRPAGHLAPTPHTGWKHGGPRSDFDQQPIEAAALADACARAYEVTGDPDWLAGVARAADWFLGINDLQLPLFDAATGGSFDALCQDGRNPNQGAESTIALISTLQQAQRHWSEATTTP